MKTHGWLCFGLLALAGCSQPSTSSPKQPAVDEREAGQSWERFISKAKDRKKEAQSAWQRKYDKGDLTVEFLRDDVKFDSARGTMIGEVQLKTSEYTLVSYKNLLPGGGYGKGSGAFSEYTLRFRYSSGGWQFMDGIRKSADIHNKTDFHTSSVESLSESHNFHLREMFQP